MKSEGTKKTKSSNLDKTMETKKSVFATLNAIDCNEHVEKKNGLSYLSWAWAWQIVKKNYPDATYTVYETANGINYFTDGRTCWVKTGVTINGLEHIEYLPVMDFRNNSILLDKVTSFDVNKAIQRSLTKACARHGLGLYIYAGEDLPDSADGKKAYKPMDKTLYAKVIECYAKGIPAKSGESYRSVWIATTNAGEKEINQFDADVDAWVESHMRRIPVEQQQEFQEI